ncbi:hypothetical protein HK097_009539 [Rhizophlyctis rosea]|uniref:Uncharacterized protein n=1 Tax=Rhizophlyctis rosea TaxID=64517 RepID=A0AAD5X922_9FUNG|nr:hypothetical protein HK097_009539 [Rhizophlyctis rosea]
MSLPTHNQSTTSTTQNPSLIKGHLNYVAGAVEETLGSLTSSPSLQQQGHDMKEQAVNELRAYDSQSAEQRHTDVAARAVQNPTILKTEGQAENLAGKATFCPGMQKFGAEKQAAGEEAGKL